MLEAADVSLFTEASEEILAEAFLANCISAVQLDLRTGRGLILKDDLDKRLAGSVLALPELIECYARQRVCPPDREKIRSITLEQIRRSCREEAGPFPLEVRCYVDDGSIQWVRIAITSVGTEGNMVMLTTRNIDETMLIRRIVDLFVYRNYDYLYLIDAVRDTYIRYTGSKGNTPIPPEKGEHYTQDMMNYNRQYVTPEDYERVTANMQLPHVIEMLEHDDTYSFTSGGITSDGKYRRSRVMFLYYDKSSSLILTARTDVTQIYLEEQEKNRQLADALRRAQHDALTGIYNQKATGELIMRSLETQYHSMAAIFFIDVDNFKMVNDTLGHQKGDELLCYLARSIQEIAGWDGIAGRMGGDEYLLYVPVVGSSQDIEQIALQICNVFGGYPSSDLQDCFVSCSVGISVYPRDGTDYETLLCKADQALYISKRYGKKSLLFLF